MCGRFTLRKPSKEIAESFGLFEEMTLKPHFNIAPTQMVAAVRVDPHRKQREMTLLKWGLIPHWADDPAIGNRMINARSETAASKPSFRAAFRYRRCLIPSDCFYEWQKVGTKKQPYLIGVGKDELFAFAGLWEDWEREGQIIQSCCILTTDANELMKPIHDRMPVILHRQDYDLWLDPGIQNGSKVQHLLRPFPETEMFAYPVSTWVNSPSHDDARCVEKVA
jgi:putative SOS response-associated peptidase YedK